jgi:protoporphyrinogen oxidase
VIHLTYEKDHQSHQAGIQHLISSAPITSLIAALVPEPPESVSRAAQQLSYRSFVIVVLMVDRKDLFPDQWLYIHDPDVKVGRIQNFKNWSIDMVPDTGKTSVGMEYFCNQGDDFWSLDDEVLFRIASRELAKLGLVQLEEIMDSYIVRQPAAYPVYDPMYDKHLTILRDYLRHFDNLQTIGRNGMHRYNNMDHSMQSGILAAENVLGGDHDLWEINEDEAYLEA